MAGIAILLPAAVSGIAGLVVGTGLFGTRYVFDSTVPIYIAATVSAVTVLFGLGEFRVFNRRTTRSGGDILDPLVITGMMFIAFGIGCAITGLGLNVVVKVAVPLIKNYMLPAAAKIGQNIKHQHDL